MATTAPPLVVEESQGTFYKLLKQFILIPVDKAMLRAAPELGHLTPILAIFGSLFFGLLTLNPSIALLGGSAIEASLLFGVLQSLFSYTATPYSSLVSEQSDTKQARCTSFFHTITPSRFKLFLESGLRQPWPNSPLYFLSFFTAYCIQSMLFFNKETANLGPAYSNRPYLATIAAVLLLSIYFIYLMVYGCDSFFTAAFSIVAGLVVGLLICMQNYAIFGKENVNVLFIPPIMRKENMDYICVASAQ